MTISRGHFDKAWIFTTITATLFGVVATAVTTWFVNTQCEMSSNARYTVLTTLRVCEHLAQPSAGLNKK